jgi:hypothetical protein
MIRVAGIFLLVNVAQAQTATVSPPNRAPYRDAYSKWRLTEPTLERDAAAGGATLGARADKAAAAAAPFYAAKKAYLAALQADAEQKTTTIEAQPALPEFDGNPLRQATLQSATINRTIESIANDPDRAIQQLRLALERERAALTALTAGLNDVQKGRDAVAESSAAVEQSRLKLIQHYQAIAASLKQTALQTEQVGTLWAAYYRALSDSTRGIAPRESLPVTSSASVSVPSVAAPSAAPTNAPSAIPNPAPVARAKSITPLPLSRYVGAWVYPTVGARYHGAEPEFVDMVLHEENGQASGTLFARFKLPQGSPGDPTVKFDFEGAFQSTRNQSFELITSGGAKGLLELIPGPAFNLLEVTFTTEDKPGTVRQGNFLLVKK